MKDEIVIIEVNDKPNVVTFRILTAKILQNFYNEQKFSDSTGEKVRILLAAAKLLKTEREKNEMLLRILSKQWQNRVTGIL